MEQTIGKRIMQNRKRLGLTQDQLAEKLGVTAQAVSKWENDQSCPDINILPELAQIFGISTDALLGREEPVYRSEVIQNETAYHYKNGLRGKIGFAAAILTVGAVYLAAQFANIDLSFWNALWPSFLLIYGLWGVYPKFSFLRLGCAILGGGYLADAFFRLQLQIDNRIILALVIILFGLSLLLDNFYKKDKWQLFHIPNVSGSPKQKCDVKDGYFDYSLSFAEDHQSLELPLLHGGSISASFGEFSLDLAGVAQVSDKCTIDASCSFGELELLIPGQFTVKALSKTAFGNFDVVGSPNPESTGIIYLKVQTSFGETTVRYI